MRSNALEEHDTVRVPKSTVVQVLLVLAERKLELYS